VERLTTLQEARRDKIGDAKLDEAGLAALARHILEIDWAEGQGKQFKFVNRQRRRA